MKTTENVSFYNIANSEASYEICPPDKNRSYANVVGTTTILKMNLTRFARNVGIETFGVIFKHCVTMCMNVKEEADKLSNFSHPSTDSDHFSRLKSTTFRFEMQRFLGVKGINIKVKSATTGE